MQDAGAGGFRPYDPSKGSGARTAASASVELKREPTPQGEVRPASNFRMHVAARAQEHWHDAAYRDMDSGVRQPDAQQSAPNDVRRLLKLICHICLNSLHANFQHLHAGCHAADKDRAGRQGAPLSLHHTIYGAISVHASSIAVNGSQERWAAPAGQLGLGRARAEPGHGAARLGGRERDEHRRGAAQPVAAPGIHRPAAVHGVTAP